MTERLSWELPPGQSRIGTPESANPMMAIAVFEVITRGGEVRWAGTLLGTTPIPNSLQSKSAS